MKSLHALFLLLFSLIPHRIYVIAPASAQTLATAQNQANAAAFAFPPTPSNHPAWDIYALAPALRPIAACESTGDKNGAPREFNSDGSILWGQENNASGTTITVKRDCGEGQINTWAHGRYPNGLNVCGNEDDNVYEMYLLYQKAGLSPWNASKATCWGSVVQNPSSSGDSSGHK